MIPTHLDALAVQTNDTWDPLEADLRCPCECKVFQIWSDGGSYSSVVQMCCIDCESEHVVIDRKIHGWSAFVSQDDGRTAHELPVFTERRCEECDATGFEVSVYIAPEKEQFLEIAADDDRLDKARWADAFSSIDINTICHSCSTVSKQWICMETA